MGQMSFLYSRVISCYSLLLNSTIFAICISYCHFLSKETRKILDCILGVFSHMDVNNNSSTSIVGQTGTTEKAKIMVDDRGEKHEHTCAPRLLDPELESDL